MKWLELSVQVPSEFVEPVTYLFGKYGRAVSIERLDGDDRLIRTYIGANAVRSRNYMEIGIRLIGKIVPINELEIKVVERKVWEESWKDHFSLIKIGDRIIIRPPWIDYKPVEGDRVIVLDPGLAFGTGHHPSTAMCIQLLEELIRPGIEILDMGTGSGILAISAIKLGAYHVTALDSDKVAVKVARKNLRSNGINREQVSLSSGSLPHRLVVNESIDLVLVNIGAKVIIRYAVDMLGCLKKGGVLIASGILTEQTDEVRDALNAIGFCLSDNRSVEDWSAMVFRKTL